MSDGVTDWICPKCGETINSSIPTDKCWNCGYERAPDKSGKTRWISGWTIGCILGGILQFLSVFSSNYPVINVVAGVIFFICAVVIQVVHKQRLKK